MRRWLNLTACWMIGSSCFAGWMGCGGKDDFGENIRLSADRHREFARSSPAGRSFKLSDDSTFNVYDTHRESSGLAEALAHADLSGHAKCHADATRGGSATAEFQVGHVLRYTDDEPFEVDVSFQVDYECLINHAPDIRTPPSLVLKAYLMDSNRRMLGKIILTQIDKDRLPTKWAGVESPSFRVTLQPQTAYHLIVAGRAEAVSSGDGAGPAASIELKSLRIDVTPSSG